MILTIPALQLGFGAQRVLRQGYIQFTALPDDEAYDKEEFSCPCLNGTGIEEGSRAALSHVVRMLSESLQHSHLTLDLESK